MTRTAMASSSQRPENEDRYASASPWKLGRDGSRQTKVPHRGGDRIFRIAERHAGREVERDRNRGQLAGMIDAQRPEARFQPRHRVQRHQLAAGGLHVEHRERLRPQLELRQQFHDDLVRVAGRIDRRDLPRAVRVVQGQFDLRRRNAQRRGLVAINLHIDLRVLQPQVARDILESRQRADLGL